jgi:hypothetical protein
VRWSRAEGEVGDEETCTTCIRHDLLYFTRDAKRNPVLDSIAAGRNECGGPRGVVE